MQHGKGQVGPEVRQHGFQSWTGPAHEVEQPALDGSQFIFKALALTGQALECMSLGIEHVDRIGGHAAEQWDGTEHVRIGGIGLGVLAEVAAQRTDALALDPDDLDPGLLEPVGDREPGHAGRLHDGGDGAVRRHPVTQLGDEVAEAVGRQPEAD